MDQKYAWVFINAWNDVFSSFSSKKVLTADIMAAKEEARPFDISVIIGIVGDVDGQVFLSMDGETGELLASEMLGGMDVAGMEDVVKSAVGEFCNMIMGNACSGIGGANRNVDITPPTVVSYEEAAALEGKPSFVVSLAVEDLGVVDFDVSIKSA
ncbi:MAG: chemotaxis protein CheX [Peptococcaceae bacterium]|nr:chemotaxis protein CheX [Peptococcaceae bacterium]